MGMLRFENELLEYSFRSVEYEVCLYYFMHISQKHNILYQSYKKKNFK